MARIPIPRPSYLDGCDFLVMFAATGDGAARMAHAFTRGTRCTERSKCSTGRGRHLGVADPVTGDVIGGPSTGGESCLTLSADRAPTFYELFSRGEVVAEQIDDYVDRWHDGRDTWAKQMPLHEYLGSELAEYQNWVRDAGALPRILAARRQAAV